MGWEIILPQIEYKHKPFFKCIKSYICWGPFIETPEYIVQKESLVPPNLKLYNTVKQC